MDAIRPTYIEILVEGLAAAGSTTILRHPGRDVAASAVLAEQRLRLPIPGNRTTGWGPSVEECRDVARAKAGHAERRSLTVERVAPATGHRPPTAAGTATAADNPLIIFADEFRRRWA